MNAGDWNCGRSGVKGVIPPLWDDLLERTAWVARDWEGKDRSFKVELWFKEKTVKGLRSSEEGRVNEISLGAFDLRLLRFKIEKEQG